MRIERVAVPAFLIYLALSSVLGIGCAGSNSEAEDPSKPRQLVVWQSEMAAEVDAEKFLRECPVNTALEMVEGDDKFVAYITHRPHPDEVIVRWCMQDYGCSRPVQVWQLMPMVHYAYLPDRPDGGRSPKNTYNMIRFLEQKPVGWGPLLEPAPAPPSPSPAALTFSTF